MIRVLIADDEPHFRNYMERVLAWEELGFKICGICKNGDEALETTKETFPDIVLLDINMPGMDGISLARILKQRNPNLYIVFVTGYSEFEYARKAAQIGVDEYILKPFTKEELTNIMIKLKLKIQKQTASLFNQKADKEIVKEELLKQLIRGISPNRLEEFLEKLERVDIQLSGTNYLVSVIEIDNISNMWKQSDEIDLWKFGISNVTQEVFTLEGIRHIIFNGFEDRIVSILINNSDIDLHEFTKPYYESINLLIKEYFSFTISIGIGTVIKNAGDIAESYRHAMAALEEKFLLGPDRVICYDDVARQNREANFYRLDLNESLLNCLRKHEEDELLSIIDEARQVIMDKNLTVDYAYMMISGMMSICLSYITEMNGNISEIYGSEFSPYSELYAKGSLDECFSLLKEIFLKAMDAFKVTYSKRGIEIVQQVQQYIENNYKDPELTVEKIAAGVFLDSSYIRRVISRQMGCTVSDLVTNIRMKEAVRLMEHQELSIADIAEQIGYNEPGYFSKCFKKCYGITPKQYYNQRKS